MNIKEIMADRKKESPSKSYHMYIVNLFLSLFISISIRYIALNSSQFFVAQNHFQSDKHVLNVKSYR